MDTIAAISTPLGNGGIGIVRISGNNSLRIIKQIFRTKYNDFKPNSIVYGKIYDGEVFLDEALVSYFKAPNSYTGEDIVEINSHGGTLVVQNILNLVIKNGAKLAEPGEFTKRAFLNGKKDLSQAEAVIDIINSKTNLENRVSADQLNGHLGKEIGEIKKGLIDLLVDIEANVDYPEYDIEETSQNKARQVVNNALDKLKNLSNSFMEGKLIKNGINVAIIGRPNVGKSSLLNKILKEERAIVTDIAGTTRDTIEESIIYNGLLINLIDTAGIHRTDDTIEEIGIEKSIKAIDKADISLMVIDNSEKLTDDDYELLSLLEDKKKIVVLNKSDLNDKIKEELLNFANKDDIVIISAKNNNGIENVLNELINRFKANELSLHDEIIISNQRHKEAIDNTISSLENVIKSLDNNIPMDMISIDIQNAISYIGLITGENVSEDVINGIFAKFCLGK